MMPTLSPTLAEHNLQLKLGAVSRQIPNATIATLDSVQVVNSGFTSDTFNTAFGGDISELVAQAVKQYYRDIASPMAWWLGPSSLTSQHQAILESCGFTLSERHVGMTCQLHNHDYVDLDLPHGFSIKCCVSVDDYYAFGAVLSSIFDPIDESVKAFYQKIGDSSRSACQEMVYYIGYHEGIPVTTGALFLTDVAGIYDVATRPEYRRRGFGSALFRHLVNEAKQAKYESAVLVASAEGAGIYERTGFQKDCVVEEWSFAP
jgi:ribosomal protein S18 acetylase RimI-like enzyme